jgi:hypothetical protein
MANQGATGYTKELRAAANAHKDLLTAANKLVKGLESERDVVKKLALSIMPAIQNNKDLTDTFIAQSNAVATVTQTIKKFNLTEKEKGMIIKQVVKGVRDNILAQKSLQKEEEKALLTKEKLNTKIQIFKDKLIEAGLPIRNVAMHLGQFDQFARLAGAAANGDARAMAALSRETTRLVNSQKKANVQIKRVTTSVREQSKESRGLLKNLRNAKGETGIFSTSLATMRGNLLLASFAMRQTLNPLIILGQAAIDAASNFEIYKIQLENVLGSQQEAQTRFEKFKVVAATTPFNLDEVMQSGVILERFGQDSQDLIKVMADLAVFMNMSMPEATSAFGRALSGGEQASRIFRNRGLFNLIKTFNEIKVLPKDLDEFKTLMVDTFKDTEAGISGVTDKMSETIKVQFSNLQDDWLVVLAKMGDALKPFNQALITFAKSFIKTEEAIIASGIVATLGALGVAIKLIAVAAGSAVGTWLLIAGAITAGAIAVQKGIAAFLTWKNSTEDLGNELTHTDKIIQDHMAQTKEWQKQQEEAEKLEFERAEAQRKLNEEIEENSEKIRVQIRLMEADNELEKEAIKLGRELGDEERALIELRNRKEEQLEKEIELNKLINESMATMRNKYSDVAIQQARLNLLVSQGLSPSDESLEFAKKLNEQFDDRIDILQELNNLTGLELSPQSGFTDATNTNQAMKDFAKDMLDVGISFEELRNKYDDSRIEEIFNVESFEALGKTKEQAETLSVSFGILFDKLLEGAEVGQQIKEFMESLIPPEDTEVSIPGLGKVSDVLLGFEALMDMSTSYRSMVMSGIEEERNAEIKKAKDTITNERKLKRELVKINDKFDNQRAEAGKDMQKLMIAEAIANASMAGIKVWSEGKSTPLVRGLQYAAITAMLGAQVAKIKAQKFAQGGDFVTSGPQMIMVGDNPGGKERVQVTPLSSPNIAGPQGNGSINVTFTGNVMSQDFIEEEAIPMIKESLRRGGDLDHTHGVAAFEGKTGSPNWGDSW